MSAREDVPAPEAQGQDYVSLPALSMTKIELYRAMRADGVGKAALSRRLGVALPQIDRLLDLRHASRLDAIERAFAVLGRTMGRTMGIVIKAAA
jgi:antitoxin HicB